MLTEALLHFTGATTRMGNIEDGSTVSDFEDEEIRRAISLSSAVIPIEYKNIKINLLDTPGFNDFLGELISTLRISDGAVVVVDAVSGAEVGTEIALGYCDEFKLPRLFVINKMDRDTANFTRVLASCQAVSVPRLILIQLPWGEKKDFKGVLDLLTMKAYPGDGKSSEDIPAEFLEAAEAARVEMIEAAAEGDDALLEKYLEGGELSADEIMQGLVGAVHSVAFAPVLVTSATLGIGTAPLLDAIVNLLPSPAEAPAAVAQGIDGDEELPATDAGPLAAYAWKTTADPFVGKITYVRVYSGVLNSDSQIWNRTKDEDQRLGALSVIRGKEQIKVKTIHAGDIFAVPKLGETATGDTFCDRDHPLSLPIPDYPNALFRVSINPKTQADSAKMGPTLTRLCEEDLTLSWYNEPSTKQTILQGLGDQHIDVAVRKAENKFKVGLEIEVPLVPYQETITKTGQGQYRHKKQSGGSGQFGEVHLRVDPLAGEEFEFANEVVGGAVSQNYMGAIEKGIRSVMLEGVIAGYPVHQIKAAVIDGKEHAVDSKPIAFEIAGREAFKLAVNDAGPVLLEPIMNVTITVPEPNMGDVLGDLNSRRSHVQGMDTDKGRSIVTAQVPMAEMMRYTTELRSITGGRGIFTMEHSHYKQVPAHLTQEIVDVHAKSKDEEE